MDTQNTVLEGTVEAPTGKIFQFTKEANRRLRNAPTEQMELRLRKDIFRDRTNVDLLEVELAILKLEQDEGKRESLEADPDELQTCDLGEELGLTHCVGKFLPKKWVKRQGNVVKNLGNWNASFSDETVLTACHNCQQDICARVAERNNAIVAGCQKCKEMNDSRIDGRHNDHAGENPDNLTVPMPHFWSFDEATEIFEEIKDKKLAALEQEKRMSEANKARAEKKRQADEKASKFIGTFAQRAKDFIPKTKRGVNRGNGTRFGQR